MTIQRWIKTPESVLITGSDEIWGVFKRGDSIGSTLVAETELISVHTDQGVAAEIAEGLNETQGFIEYMIHGDPESGVYLSREYFSGQVAVRGATGATLLSVEYEMVD